jgi:oligopeptide/dipeptide ABC transporter ATP-binding protein
MHNAAEGLKPLLNVQRLKMYFPGPRQTQWPWSPRAMIKAVDDVSFSIPVGTTLSLVGESGCGKSTIARCILQLHKPTAGVVMFEGVNLCTLDRKALRQVRRKAQIVFQDPYLSLDPRRTIGYTIGEPLELLRAVSATERRQAVHQFLHLVGLDPMFENRYPHELSGGQRQRVGLARALITNPTFVVADEPISALDVSIQAQVINLMRDLQERLRLTYLFISHDLRVVRYVSDQIAVMYLGKIMEIAPTERLFSDPLHPYTQLLLSAVPRPRWQPNPAAIRVEGEVPSPINRPQGCPFASRCPRVRQECREADIPLVEVKPGHNVACLFWDT